MRKTNKARRARRHCDRAWHRRFGARMRVLRLALGLTEADAAAIYGVTLGTYQRYEAGARMRSGVGKLMRLCERYPAVSLDWILEGDTRNVPRELSHTAPGKVAILPVVTREQRERRRERRAAAAMAQCDREGA